MARWHLDELRTALEGIGWRIAAELPGDDYRVSATWELRRSGYPAGAVVDFEGLDDLKVLPIEQSYGCHTRGAEHSLYFRRRGQSGSPARARWRRELDSFVKSVGS